VDKIITEEEEVELAKPPESGFFPRHVKKQLLVVDTERSIREFVQKSFHLDKYCFDSGTEKKLFFDLLKRVGLTKLYFTLADFELI
jgi:type III restriction enzyme